MIADRAHTRFRGQTGLAARLALRLAPRLVAALAALWIALAVPVAALAQDEPDYASWEQAASRGEDVVEAGTASTPTLEALRADIVAWRDQFVAAQSINAPRIAALKDQIAALGPAPAEGDSEAADIAARRKDLNDQLAQLQAPGLRAVEAYSRADQTLFADRSRALSAKR